MSIFSKTQIDKLGERLRQNEPSEVDLKMVEDYRRLFESVYETGLSRLRTNGVHGELSGRAAKTTPSIIQKLRRHQTRHVRLSQVQDICGLRVVVETTADQDLTVQRLTEIFPGSLVDDRREHPSHGYRAVHMVAPVHDLFAEIQIRTKFQHMWAQFCENLADKLGVEVKYGGHPAAQKLLDTFSDAVRNIEEGNESGMIRERPDLKPLVPDDFLFMFRALLRLVEQAPSNHLKEVDHVLPD